MKITVTKENLLNGLNIISPAIRPHGSLPILENVLLKTEKGRLYLIATDLEIGIETAIGAKVDIDGSITLPARQFTEFIAGVGDENIDIKVEKSIINISSQHSKASFNGINAEDFPPLPKSKNKGEVSLKAIDFIKAVDKTVFASATDNTRPVLAGVYIEVKASGAVFVATDSYRLSEYKVKLDKDYDNFTTIIPAKTLVNIKRLTASSIEKIIVLFEDNQVTFNLGDTVITSRTIEGTFPDYKQIIPKENNLTAVINRDGLMKAVKMTAVFSREVAGTTKLVVDEDKQEIDISAVAPQSGKVEAKLEAKISGGSVEISFNGRFISELLTAISGEEVEFKFNKPETPVIITEADSTFLHLIMPLKED